MVLSNRCSSKSRRYQNNTHTVLNVIRHALKQIISFFCPSSCVYYSGFQFKLHVLKGRIWPSANISDSTRFYLEKHKTT